MTTNIEIYTTSYCSYCARAKALLDQKGARYHEISVEDDPQKRQEMEQRSGRRTVPQIFINDQHIGGCDDLMLLDKKGNLDPILEDKQSN